MVVDALMTKRPITSADLNLLWSDLTATKHVIEDLLRHAKGTATLANDAMINIEHNIRLLKQLEDLVE